MGKGRGGKTELEHEDEGRRRRNGGKRTDDDDAEG